MKTTKEITGKKVLFFCGGTYVYGKEKSMLTIMEGLQKNGFEVMNVVSGWNNGMFPKMLTRSGIPYQTIKLGKFSKSLKSPYWKWTLNALIHYPGALLSARKIIKNFQPDILFFDNYSSVILLQPVLNDYPIIIRQAEQPTADFFFRRIINSKSLVNRITFLGISKFITKELNNLGIPKSNLNHLYTGFIIPKTAKNNYFNNGNLIVGCIGRIEVLKGQGDFLVAINLLKNQKLSIFGKLVGSGDQKYLGELIQYIEKNDLKNTIKIEAYTEKVEDFFRSIDVCVVPSRVNEALGRVAAEASSYGIPVIVTNRGGLPELVLNGSTGFIVPAESPEQIAEKIECFFRNPTLLISFGHNARSFIEKNFSQKQQIAKLVNICKTTLTKQKDS